ncbi:MAG: ASCH domain-containing protein [Acidilobus sp.]
MDEGPARTHGIGRTLKFKKRYLEKVLEGRKRSTIRLGRVVVRDRIVTIVGDGRPVALARIDEVIYKKVKDLTDEDARLDGFKGLAELFRELRKIYGDFTLEDDITILRFTLLKRLDEGSGSSSGRPR